jgi:transposase-like protein
MISCPKCEASPCVKDGIVKGKQRDFYHVCEYRHTGRHRGKNPALKRQAVELYLEGLGVRSIGRLLNCGHVAVDTWLNAYGESIATLRSGAGVTVIAMDEWHTSIGAKKRLMALGGCGAPCKTIPPWRIGDPAIPPRASNSGRPSRATPSKP